MLYFMCDFVGFDFNKMMKVPKSSKVLLNRVCCQNKIVKLQSQMTKKKFFAINLGLVGL